MYNSRLRAIVLLLMAFLIASCSNTPSGNIDDTDNDDVGNTPVISADCESGLAGEYPCSNVNLLAHIPVADLLGERLNDIWGWTDTQTGKEYALVGMTDRVTFVDISTPTQPLVIGTLPESINNKMKSSASKNLYDEEENSTWRDVKVYKDHAFIVSDGQPHGLQVFDLTQLRGIEEPPVTFTENVHFTAFGNAHNIAINEESGYAYVAGSNQVGGGLYILDISDPLNPVFAGSHADSSVGFARSTPNGTSPTGYVHDTQCVIYNGPDIDYVGDEVCFNSSETHLVIANVTDKSSTVTIGKSDYSGQSYAHQGWLTEDHQYFLLDDELDESNIGTQTTTYIWDVKDLENPMLIGTYTGESNSIDHNLYVRDNHVYQANYTSGLRILNLDDISSGNLSEVAFFDTYPLDNATRFDGAWSNYPYFESGIVIVSDISNGLFILSPQL
ncbi:choice-of-anchor B family protein [Balneolaceae bacterium YR4-1]|uniref:Choice-of-anchor B family protein n=1 Tax=Halalkalibaculum roseum TaxID=2709311 RepID=A0A6M1T713_9BACT|nr:choice-of-anchor B family protein [Halalkalibaculum roseum]NGP77745.1 choice-of-anchor B family protein [Halalkalibaculum roseum]